MITLRTYTPGEALYVRLRPVDRLEVWAMSRRTPGQAVERALGLSTLAWIAWRDGQQVGYGGVAQTDEPGVGCPWLLLNDGPEVIGRKVFHRLVLKCREEADQQFHTLRNYAHESNHTALRWLQAMGFQLGQAVSVNPDGLHAETFIPFERSI